MANRKLPNYWDHDDCPATVEEAKKKLLPLMRTSWPRMQEFLWAEEQQALMKLRRTDPNDSASVAKWQGVLWHIERLLALESDIRALIGDD